MAKGWAKELVGAKDGTLAVPSKIDGRVQDAPVIAFTATLDLSQATVAKNNGDTNSLFFIPAGYKPLYLVTVGSATMGAAATLAIGNATTPNKYRAAVVHTAVDTPALTMPALIADDDPLAAEEEVLLTIGAAALPGAGTLVVTMYCSAR